MKQINYYHFLINHPQFPENCQDRAVISSNSQNGARQQYDSGVKRSSFQRLFLEAIVSLANIWAEQRRRPQRTSSAGLNSPVQTLFLSPVYFPDFMDWVRKKKPVALKIW